MRGITHEPAIQWINRRLDGLLSESKLLELDEHLRSCDSCRAYALEMDPLPAHLQNEFRTRWDEQTGPSKNVLTHVTSNARNIPRMNRISAGVRLITGAATLVGLALLINLVASQLREIPTAGINAEVTGSPIPVEGRLLAFTSDQTGNSDIYTVHPDGSGMTNLTDHPARDANPIWSPDGQHIAFESDRDGFDQIYLMDADGSDAIQLTHDEVDHFLAMSIHGETNPWSPDGNKLLFLAQEPQAEMWTLYALDITTGNTVMLANGHVQVNNLSWSPDRKYVGYVLNDSPTPEATFVTGLYVVDAAGSNIIAINNLLPPGDVVDKPSYSWSGDGSSITFIAYRNLDGATDQWLAYEVVLDSQELIERAISSTIMESWWAGTSLVADYEAGIYSLTWLRPDGTSSNFKPLEICDLTVEADYGFVMRRSPHGSQVINVACPNKDAWFYYASSDGTIIKPLMTSPIPSTTVDNTVTSMTWSSDDQFIAVTLVSPEQSSLYILNVNDPSIQPQEIVISGGELYITPSWQPTP